jgi:hypothetical protein
VFSAKSAEALEKKRVEFLDRAKNDKRVRKDLKRKNLVGSEWWVVGRQRGRKAGCIGPVGGHAGRNISQRRSGENARCGKSGTYGTGGDGVADSLGMVTWKCWLVKYYYDVVLDSNGFA